MISSNGGKRWKGTYKRKYYLHRMIRKSGLGLHLGLKHKTITVNPELVCVAKESKYVSELQNRFNYGVQMINPILCEQAEVLNLKPETIL